MQKKYVSGRLLLAAVCFACCFSFPSLAVEAPEGEDIAQGVYVEEIDVSGMTHEEALAALDGRTAAIAQAPVTITFGGTVAEDGTVTTDKILTTTLGELGLSCTNRDVIDGVEQVGRTGSLVYRYKQLKDLDNENLVFDLTYSLDETIVNDFINNNSAPFNVEPVNATIRKNGNGFSVTDSQVGMSVDAAGTAAALMAAGGSWESSEPLSVAAVVSETQPYYTKEALSTIQNKLGEGETKYSGGDSLGRNINLKVGTALIDGSVVMPGEVFSANAAMEPYTEDRGWAYGGSYTADGKVEQSLGGGICQISSTMYNAALKAEVGIAQRNNHSMTVNYLPIGLDAAIAGDWKDLKIQNNYATPIYIECYASRGTLYFAIWGQETRPANRTVNYYSVETGSWEEPPVYEDDPTLPLGKEEVSYNGSVGRTSVTYKEVKIDGVVTETTVISEDYYRASAKVIRRGTNADLAKQPENQANAAGVTPEGGGGAPEGGGTPNNGGAPEGGGTPNNGGAPEGGGTPNNGDTPNGGGTPEGGNAPEGGSAPGGEGAPGGGEPSQG
ncbi:MAG: hypothetical protein HFI93_06010 [Lachnospiraceae bacterium]|nr:hypothetical protein [Lachnospiraceae bacterium]